MHTFALAVALVMCGMPGGPGDDRASLEELLVRMERAVLRADAMEYLACIDQGEPEWVTEQRNWAADLAAHTPESFDLELTSDPAADDAGFTAGLRMAWTLPGGATRRVVFPARFTNDERGWLFAGEAWQRLASGDGQNIVLFLAEDLRPVADRIIEIMPEIREHVDEGFETRLDHPQVIKLYGDMRHLQQSIYLSYEEPLGGWNEPGEAIKILADPGMSARRLRTLLAHEYGHVASFTYGPDASNNLPWWVAEGAAELAAERYAGPQAREGVEQLLRAWAAAGSLADWEAMADFRRTPPELHGHVYAQGHHFVGYVSERFGRTARNAWVRLLVRGASTEDAAAEAFGIGFEDLDRQWRASLQPRTDAADDQ